MKTHKLSTIPEIGDFLLSQFQNTINKQGTITLALSGGNTPKDLFMYWANNKADSSAWHNIHYYWVDERAVAPNHDESNFGVANTLFFKPLGISDKHIFRMHGESSIKDEALRYHTLLSTNISQKDGVPQFNFIILGLGDDGHTASIFPGQESTLFQSAQFCEKSVNPYTQQRRITLTGSVINNAENVFFIILGQEKKQIFSEVFIQKNTPKKYPAQYVCPKHTELQIITNII